MTRRETKWQGGLSKHLHYKGTLTGLNLVTVCDASLRWTLSGMGIGRGSADFRWKRKMSAPKNKTVRSNQNVMVLHQVKNWQNWKMQDCFMQFLRLIFVKKLQLRPQDPNCGPSAAPRPPLFSWLSILNSRACLYTTAPKSTGSSCTHRRVIVSSHSCRTGRWPETVANLFDCCYLVSWHLCFMWLLSRGLMLGWCARDRQENDVVSVTFGFGFISLYSLSRIWLCNGSQSFYLYTINQSVSQPPPPLSLSLSLWMVQNGKHRGHWRTKVGAFLSLLSFSFVYRSVFSLYWNRRMTKIRNLLLLQDQVLCLQSAVALPNGRRSTGRQTTILWLLLSS